MNPWRGRRYQQRHGQLMEGSSGDKGRDEGYSVRLENNVRKSRKKHCSYQFNLRHCQMSDILLYVRYFHLNEDINSSKCVLYYQHGMSLGSICL